MAFLCPIMAILCPIMAIFSKKAYILEQGIARTQKRGSPGEAGSEPEYVV